MSTRKSSCLLAKVHNATNETGLASDGLVAAQLGDLDSWLPSAEKTESQAASGTDQGSKSTGAGGDEDCKEEASSTKDTPVVWYNRDEKLMSEISKHRAWMTSTRALLEEARDNLSSTLLETPKDVVGESILVGERRLVETRLRALKLVLSEPEIKKEGACHNPSLTRSPHEYVSIVKGIFFRFWRFVCKEGRNFFFN